MLKKYIKFSLVCSIFVSTSLVAIDDEFEDDGFGDEEAIEIVQTIKEDIKPYSIYGSVSFDTSYNYAHKAPTMTNFNDFRGFSSAKLSTNLNFDYKFKNDYKFKTNLKLSKDFIYDLKNEDYNVVPDDYETYSDINEFYLQGNLSSNFDFKIGRQIVVWGKSDNIRITDTLNPMNNLSPAMTDIEDLRLGRVMGKFDYYINDWDISAIWLVENRYSLMPTYGSDFAPANKIFADKLSVDEPSNSLSNSGVAFSLSKNYEGQDVAFYASNQFVDNTLYKTNMVGFAYNKVISNFLFKTEAAYFDNYDTNFIDEKTDGLVGVEYNGIDDGTISLEIANKDREIQYAIRFNQSYINQTLDFTTLINLYGKNGQDGGFIRAWFDYDYDDDISLSVGVVDYINGDDLKFKMLKDNDRVFASMSYSF